MDTRDKPKIATIGLVKQEKPIVRTRFGYDARDCVKSLQEVLSQSGPAATGKALHYTADLICSGGFEIWIRLIWSFVFQHVQGEQDIRGGHEQNDRCRQINLRRIDKSPEYRPPNRP